MDCRGYMYLLVFVFIVTGIGVAQDRSVVLSYQTDTAPTIDGVIEDGEWDAAGPWIEVTAESPGARFDNGIDEDEFGGDSDLSYRFKTMWMNDWFIYFVFEITDDIAMEEDPRNLWERDQLEFFMDGNDIPEGNDDNVSFHWWESDEPFGKFGCSRNTTYEGNPGKMSDNIDDILFAPDSFASTAVASETGEAANFVIEYAITLEHLWIEGWVDFLSIPDDFAIKWTASYSDNDNFDNGEFERSSTLTYWRDDGTGEDPGWDVSSSFADLTLTGQFTKVQNWPLF